MVRFSTIAIAVCLLASPLGASVWAQAPVASAAQPGPDERARQWLTLVDDSNYTDGAGQMGPQARKADISTIPKLREPLGAVANRNLKDVKLAASNPGMPSGQYAVVRFDSNFAHKANAVETVILALTKGAWAVVGYRIN